MDQLKLIVDNSEKNKETFENCREFSEILQKREEKEKLRVYLKISRENVYV